MKTINKSTVFIIICLLLISTMSFAQGGGFPLPGEDGDPGTGIDAPINFLIYFGIAIGSIFGYNKLKNKD